MKGKFLAAALAAFLIGQQPALSQIAKNGDLPPCSNPNVCGSGKDPRPALALKFIWIDAKDWFPQKIDSNSPFAKKVRVVGLDAGHGGSDGGAQRAAVLEKELTLQIVQKYAGTLYREGAIPVLTRAIDMFVGLDERAGVLSADVDALRGSDVAADAAAVSVHINSTNGETTARGIETYYTTDASKPLAEFVHKALVKATGAPDRGIVKNGFYVPKNTTCPAILVEHGFINNSEERKLMQSEEYQNKMAQGMKQGLTDYFAWLDKQKTDKKNIAPTMVPPLPEPSQMTEPVSPAPAQDQAPSYAPFFKVPPDGEWPGCYGF